ncbi:hypothetical protein [Salinarimonas ramus]|uniref:Uncharacterized protein n=1 Tax=Salinarimonas ramus TaxID=690164 RepID=A0A917Q8V7_9HYPH|nr:hypothetical protein [Salinarimonas ramus]GGK35410.1 hypothetical protein GCM10011322_22830 [Salinarimonas ramus]
MADPTYTAPAGAAHTDSSPSDPATQNPTPSEPPLSALATELRSRVAMVEALGERLSREGVDDDARDARLRAPWAACDALAGRIARRASRTLLDLEAKAAAFLWLDSGATSADDEPHARLVADVMTFLAGGISDCLAPDHRDTPLDVPRLFATIETQALVARARTVGDLLALHEIGRLLRERAGAPADASPEAVEALDATRLALGGLGAELEEEAAARLATTEPRTAEEARGRAIALYVREAAAPVPDCLERAARVTFRLGFDLPGHVS